MSSDQQQAMYKAIVEFVQTEYVNGTSESGQSCECLLLLYVPPFASLT